MKKMPAGQFKAQCLSVMDEVQQTGVPVLITKHGKPVARLVPATEQTNDIFDSLADKATIMGDIMTSTAPEDWFAE